jgi:hypothetical protein
MKKLFGDVEELFGDVGELVAGEFSSSALSVQVSIFL